MLDAGPLGMLARRNPRPEIFQWFRDVAASRATLIVPEVADFEVRREFLLAGLDASVTVLDRLKTSLTYSPITTGMMLKAAELWADARRRGRPTADPKELDCDVILAAQALAEGAVIATENVGHLARYVPARHRRQIKPA